MARAGPQVVLRLTIRVPMPVRAARVEAARSPRMGIPGLAGRNSTGTQSGRSKAESQCYPLVVTPADVALDLAPVGPTPARALAVDSDGTLYLARHLAIFRSTDDGASWSRVAEIDRPVTRRLAEASTLATRLLRHEVRALARLACGTLVAATRGGLYHASPQARRMSRARFELNGTMRSGVHPPLRLEAGPGSQLVWGEYDSRHQHGRPIRLFASEDAGRSYRVVHTFAAGSVRHVHGVMYDARRDHYWVFTGDRDEESGIGMLSSDLAHFEWLVRGSQRYRAVAAFDLDSHLVYGMDSGHEPNAVMRVDKENGHTERLQEIGGSCMNACRFGGLHVLSTAAGGVGSAEAGLWISSDGESWRQVLRAKKDRWSSRYFQAGTLVLPSGASDRGAILLSGQAVSDLGGRAYVARLAADG